ncbi:MAG: DsbA family protein [Pseudomonadota bacterium]
MAKTAIKIFFNFRSPYCYLLSQSLFEDLAKHDIDLQWYSLAGWDGRSPPERANVKVPLTRQDVARWCKRLNIPFNPPPITTDPTPAAMLSLFAEARGCLAPYVKRVMWSEWAEGKDIGQTQVLMDIAKEVGLEVSAAQVALEDGENTQRLEENWTHAQSIGVIGVPSFVIGEEIFWGNDRFDFVLEHLADLKP